MGILQSIWTILVFIIFMAIVFWAFSSKQKTDFEIASRIPFEEDDETLTNVESLEKKNG